MEELNVRIVRLAPMRVASAYGFGASPEGIAWQTLLDWAKAGGLLDVAPGAAFLRVQQPEPGGRQPELRLRAVDDGRPRGRGGAG